MLELQNISYGVEQDGDSKNILRDISLTIDERFVAITGPNGGGKSTLAKVIAGILTPTQGRILLDGEDITGLDITQRAQKGISFAFQQPVRFKGLTVKDLITLACGQADRGAGGVRLSVRGGAVCQGLHRPGGGRLSVRRRAQAYRDRHDHGPGHQAVCL